MENILSRLEALNVNSVENLKTKCKLLKIQSPCPKSTIYLSPIDILVTQNLWKLAVALFMAVLFNVSCWNWEASDIHANVVMVYTAKNKKNNC